MSRVSRYDTDEERLPEGMTRVGYDADTQVYTFKDTDGSLWESAPGNQYGQLTCVSGGHSQTNEQYGDQPDNEPFLSPEGASRSPPPSWRSDLMPLLNFGVIIGVALLLFFWYLHATAGGSEDETQPGRAVCDPGLTRVLVKAGDTCWEISQSIGASLEEIRDLNPGLDCDRLVVGAVLCVP